MTFFPFSDREIDFIRELKGKRENAQYYVTEGTRLDRIDEVKDFVLKCREILEKENFGKIREELISRLD